jgi:hypothetical protein
LLLAVCLLFYKLLLQRETFYRLNRWVLLSCLLLAFVVPLLPLPQRWSVWAIAVKPAAGNPVKQQNGREPVNFALAPVTAMPMHKTPIVTTQKQAEKNLNDHPFPSSQVSPAQLSKWLFILYITGVVVFGLNLLIQLITNVYQAYHGDAIVDGHIRIVDLKGAQIPCSFFNTIFINPKKYHWTTYNQILIHEKAHIRQWHSMDILLAELVIVVQWFNPFAWHYRKEIENNLEYLADEAVLAEKNIDRSSYQLSLLKVSAPHLPLHITTNYNQSLLKNRIRMMNAKKSNIHILWKYFMLVPLFGCLACALSKPVVNTKRPTMMANKLLWKAQLSTSGSKWLSANRTGVEGFWFAAKVGDEINIDFKTTTDGHKWNYNGSTFRVGEFSALPTDKKSEFTVTREAGTILFNGKFEGDQGIGHFKLLPNQQYVNDLRKAGIASIEEHELLSLLLVDIKKDFVEGLFEAGYTNVTLSQLSALGYFKADLPYIRFWKKAGFAAMTPQDLVMASIKKIDTNYVKEVQKQGYRELTFQQIYLFSSNSITPAYIQSLLHARLTGQHSGITPPGGLSADEIISAKIANVDSAYMQAISVSGLQPTNSQLHSFKSFGVTIAYIKALQDLGYKDLNASEVLLLKMSKVTPEYIQSFHDMGYGTVPFSELILFKRQDITPDFIKGFEALGYKDIAASTVASLKRQGITPGYIDQFHRLGFTDLPIDEILLAKTAGVTPEYVSSMKQKGLNANELRKYITLKNSFNNSN